MDRLVKELRAALGPGKVISEPEELLVYECDGLTHYRHRPRAVVFPASTEEVSKVMRLLSAAGVPFVPRGAGTGLSGGALAVGGGVCIELSRMRRVLAVDVENRVALVEAGVVNAHVSRAVARHGLYYVPDPSSQGSCTVGGNIAENAGGIHCLKYGTTTDHVLGARVVLTNGRVVELGAGGASVGAGYDLLGLFVGSEGTFGVVTEAFVRLTPVAPAVRTLLADFTNIDDASRAVSAVIAAGIIPAGLEMVDGATIRAVEASVFAAGMPLDAEAALLVELDGLEAGIDEEVERVRAICAEYGARSVKLAADEAERKRLWAARKGAFGAMGRITPDILIQDAVVPRSRLPEVLAATYQIGARHGLRVANVFHAGDGNLHPLVCFDSRDAGQVERVHEAGREIMETCVRAGGTITGEHGVGLDKSEYLPLVFGEDDLRAMLCVRAAFDPTGLCNPGKIIPAPRGCGEARVVAEAKGGARAEPARRAPGEGGKPKGAAGRAQAFPAFERTALSSSQADSLPGTHADSLLNAHASAAQSARASAARGALNQARAYAALASVVGAAHVREESRAGAFDGARTLVVEPATVEEACEVLKVASRSGCEVVPAGGGAWLDAGEARQDFGEARQGAGGARQGAGEVRHGAGEVRPGAHVLLQTTRMRRVVEHEPADLVASVEAGASLQDFNREVGRAGQWLPLDPPGAGRATLGGVAATGACGPLALGYGLPRSYVLGMRVALADGRIIRAGGRVVKNVAGYDLCKLFVGSHGTLGLILELTFKLRPRPARDATLAAHSQDLAGLLGAARELVAASLLPAAVELLSPALAHALGLSAHGGAHVLLARFTGTAGAVDYQLGRAAELLKARLKNADVRELRPGFASGRAESSSKGAESSGDGAGVWERLSGVSLREESALVWRAGVLPSELGALLSKLRGRDAGELYWHAGVGDGRLRVFETAGDAGEDAARLRGLREAARARGGSLVVERAPDALKRELGAWGLTDSTSLLMRRIKQKLDPAGTFSPGRFWPDGAKFYGGVDAAEEAP